MLRRLVRGVAASFGLGRRSAATALLYLCASSLVGAASAQPPEAALLVGEARQPGPLMTPYLRAQVDRGWAQDAVRQARLDAITSETALLALQREVRRAMLDAIGGLPETRTPLNARVVGTIPCDGYRIEKRRLREPARRPRHRARLRTRPATGPAGAEAGGVRPCFSPAATRPIGKAHASYQEIAARLATAAGTS